MRITPETIRATVAAYILDEFLPGEDPAALTSATPLITGRILDSLGTLKLVAFLEAHYGFELAAHEADPEHLDTLARIVSLVQSKLSR